MQKGLLVTGKYFARNQIMLRKGELLKDYDYHSWVWREAKGCVKSATADSYL